MQVAFDSIELDASAFDAVPAKFLVGFDLYV
jgi:hypothetical protein